MGSDRSCTRETAIHRRLRRHYDQLWLLAFARIRSGEVDLDPVLNARKPDARRGLTVIARPSPTVRQRVCTFLGELRRLEPDQHYYTGSELHITILSLFTATVEFEPFFARKKDYVMAVDAALTRASPIRIQFEGITVSPGALMIQGFFETKKLDELRDRLRRELMRRGLAKGTDERYLLQTAHMTVVRFRANLRDSARFAKTLEHARRRGFGTTTIRETLLVENDWYMSRRSTLCVKRYDCSLRRG